MRLRKRQQMIMEQMLNLTSPKQVEPGAINGSAKKNCKPPMEINVISH
jgi:hypothetical protein